MNVSINQIQLHNIIALRFLREGSEYCVLCYNTLKGVIYGSNLSYKCQ